MKTITIIGMGYVGNAMANLFAKRSDLYEIVEMRAGEDTGKTVGTDLAIICVPTPSKDDGACDTSIVEEVLEWLDTPFILIKSTIPPGTTKMLQERHPDKRIVFSPEFIGEGKYQTDPKYPHPTDVSKHSFLIFGGRKGDTEEVLGYFQPIMGPSVEYLQTDSTTAEMVKYFVNTYLATKVTFCNTFYDFCQKAGISYNELRELVLKDKRIEPSHTMVFPEQRGFGGKCLPKDLDAITMWGKKKDIPLEILHAVKYQNFITKQA